MLLSNGVKDNVNVGARLTSGIKIVDAKLPLGATGM